jgi:hypothetical protein
LGRLLLFLACVVGPAIPLYAQASAPDPVDMLLRKVERILNAGDRAALPPLFGGLISLLLERSGPRSSSAPGRRSKAFPRATAFNWWSSSSSKRRGGRAS